MRGVGEEATNERNFEKAAAKGGQTKCLQGFYFFCFKKEQELLSPWGLGR